MKSVIVIIGYNRPGAVRNCYTAVRNAVYTEEDRVDLIFSLDHSDREEELTDMIDTFSWPYGEKIVITHEERLGLRRHVISCGTLVKDYDFLVMLEDDIQVSDSYYLYTREAVTKYDDGRIAAVSLYRPHVYPQNGRFFEPEYNGSDVYLMQVAQSWGQVWTRKMWDGFYTWYTAHQSFEQPERMADYSYGWDERSWLRYFMGYTADQDKYVVYPYHSFSTNTEEPGENRKITDTDYQVSLVSGQKEFRMPEISALVKYDAFYERTDDMLFSCTYSGEPVLMDLNGSRTKYYGYRYLLSTRYLPYEVIESYGIQRRPQEINYRERTAGADIFLYDLQKPVKKQKKGINPNVIRYDVRAVSWARLSYLGMTEFAQNLRKKRKKKK